MKLHTITFTFLGAIVLLPGHGLLAGEIRTGEKQSEVWRRVNQRLAVSTTVKAEWSGDGSVTQKSELTFEPEFEMNLSAGWRLTTILRLRGGETLSQDHLEIDLREFYLEGEIGRTFLTLGKQQIVWGKADGLKVLDVVNPQDFREFILDDFEDSRLPLWSLNAEIPLTSKRLGKDPTLQILWIPETTFHDLPEPGSDFELTSPRLVPTPPPGVTVNVDDPPTPNRFLNDSEIGARFSTFLKGWDLTLNAFYHHDDLPALYQELQPDTDQPTVTLRPEFERTLLFGGGFSNAFGDFTVRGELAYSTRRPFSTTDLDMAGVARLDELAFVVGLDWFGLRDTLLSVQLFQSRLDNAPASLLRRDVETRVSLLARRDFLGDRLVAEVLWLHDLDEADGLVRPKLRWEMRDALDLAAGLDIFYGSGAGTFGQFDEKDRFNLALAWGF